MKSKLIRVLKDIENDPDLVVGKKYNGFSERLVISNGVIRMFNKSGTEQTDNVPHITKVLVPKSMDLILAGEGYAPSGRVEDAKSIFGSGSAHSLAWQEKNGLARFTVVNITRWNGEDLTHIPFGERLDVLRISIINLQEYGAENVYHEDLRPYGKKRLFDDIIASGGEGVVVKSLKGLEKDWFKVKRVKTWDVVIIGFTEAREGKTGKFKGLIGAIRYGGYDSSGNLRVVGKCSGMVDEQRVAFSVAQESYIGRVIEVKGQELGNRGAIVFPRFVRLRDDKLPTDCLLPLP